MAKRRYTVGDKVLISPDESGENHVPATVVDSYELIIGDDRRAVIVAELEDGERKYLTAETPNVLPVEPEEDEAEEEAGEDGPPEAEADAEADGCRGRRGTRRPSERSNGSVVISEDDELGNP